MPSFDVVSKLNFQEVDNAVHIAQKELLGRYDFKGSQSSIEFDKKQIKLVSDDPQRMKQLIELLQSKLIKRGLSLLSFDFSETEAVGGRLVKVVVELKDGVDSDNAKRITKLIRDSKLKVSAQIMDEMVRVTGKNIDDLQSVIQLLRQAQEIQIPLQFINMRS